VLCGRLGLVLRRLRRLQLMLGSSQSLLHQ
jgi:hypothetical protein